MMNGTDSANHLAEWRRAKRLTRADLSERLGVPANTLGRWERGTLEMRHPRLVRLALEALDQQDADARRRKRRQPCSAK
jgi:transcriptional regulator with XRE-family HTH domain